MNRISHYFPCSAYSTRRTVTCTKHLLCQHRGVTDADSLFTLSIHTSGSDLQLAAPLAVYVSVSCVRTQESPVVPTPVLDKVCGGLNPCCKPQHLRSLRSQKTMSGRLTRCASKTGLGTTGPFVCSNAVRVLS